MSDLTLIDLPGTMDKRILPQVRQLVDQYVKQEQTMIIADVPANNNNAQSRDYTSSARGMSQRVAVVTKLDLLDAEKASLELLLIKNKKMYLGYHAVNGRKQRELTTGTHLWGIPTLTKRLISILQDNTRKTFQNGIAKMTSRLIETKETLSRLGSPLHTPGAQRQQFFEWVKQ